MISTVGSDWLRAAGKVENRGKQLVSEDNHAIQQNIKSNTTILDEYRFQGVELQLSGVHSVEETKQKEYEASSQAGEEAAMMEIYKQNLEAAKENADAMGEEMKNMGRALEIARRMMKGDIVPSSDEKFLMEYDKDIYLGAKNMQALCRNENSKKQDSVLEDEDKEKESQVKTEGDNICIQFEKRGYD